MSDTACRGYHGSTAECLVWTRAEADAKLDELIEGGCTVFECPDGVANENVYSSAKERGLTVRTSITDSACWLQIGGTYQIIEKGLREYTCGPADIDAVIFAPKGAASSNVLWDWALVSRCGISSAPMPDKPTIWASWVDLHNWAEYAKPEDYVVAHHIDSDTGRETLSLAADLGMTVVPVCRQARRELKRLGIEYSSSVNYLVEQGPKYVDGEFTIGIMGQAVKRKRWYEIRDAAKAVGVRVIDWATDAIDWSRDKEQFFKDAACVVSIADPEGGPLPPMEALARGRMAIGLRDVGLLGELETTGLYLMNSPGELEKTILKAKSDWEVGLRGELPDWVSSRDRLRDQIGGVL